MQQIAPKSRYYQTVCKSSILDPKDSLFCFENYAVQCVIAPCYRWVQSLEHQDLISIILHFSATKTAQQHLVDMVQVKYLDPDLGFCLFGETSFTSESELYLQALW